MDKVRVTIDNRFAYVTDVSDAAYDVLDEVWSHYASGHYFSPAYKTWERNIARLLRDGMPRAQAHREAEGWDGKVRYFKGGQVPVGLFRATREEIEKKYELRFVVEEDLPDMIDTKEIPPVTDEKYRFQYNCVSAMIAAIPTGGGIVLSSTGSGKTKMAGDFFRAVWNVHGVFIVDQVDLLYQSQKEIAEWLGEEVGIVGNSIFDPKRVTVATVQTLHKHKDRADVKKWLMKVKIGIVDELHVQMSRRNFKVLYAIKPLAWFGLTATLQLRKKAVRYKACAFAGNVIFEFPMKEGVKAGVLTKSRCIQLLFEPSDVISEQYADELEFEVLDNEMKQRAAREIIKLLIANDRFIVLLVERVAHLETLSDVMDHADIPHALAYGKISIPDRLRARKRFEKGKHQLIIANKVFKKGINLKRVDVMIDMAEMHNPDDVQQKIGRGVRLFPDKDELVYIDFGTDGTGRFGDAARKRASTLKRIGVPVVKYSCSTYKDAVRAIKKELGYKEVKCEQLALLG